MTRTPCAGAALDCIIAPWAAKIVAILRAVVEAILAVANYHRSTLPGLSRQMMPKPGFLPSWASARHVLACQRSREFGQVVTRDPRGPRAARIQAQFVAPSAIEPRRGLMAILARTDLDDDMGASGGHVPT